MQTALRLAEALTIAQHTSYAQLARKHRRTCSNASQRQIQERVLDCMLGTARIVRLCTALQLAVEQALLHPRRPYSTSTPMAGAIRP